MVVNIFVKLEQMAQKKKLDELLKVNIFHFDC